MKTGPSKPYAAELLRNLARHPKLSEYTTDLFLIAACIEGKDGMTWRRAPKNSFHLQTRINEAAYMIENHRGPLRVGALLDIWAARLAEKFGRTSPDDVQKLRDQIAEARKRQRKAARVKPGK